MLQTEVAISDRVQVIAKDNSLNICFQRKTVIDLFIVKVLLKLFLTLWHSNSFVSNKNNNNNTNHDNNNVHTRVCAIVPAVLSPFSLLLPGLSAPFLLW